MIHQRLHKTGTLKRNGGPKIRQRLVRMVEVKENVLNRMETNTKRQIAKAINVSNGTVWKILEIGYFEKLFALSILHTTQLSTFSC